MCTTPYQQKWFFTGCACPLGNAQRTTWVILTGAYYQVKAMQSYAITAAPQSGNQEKWLQSEKNGHFNAETSGRSGYFYKTKNWKERNRDILHKAQIARLVVMGVAKTFVVTESHSVTILAFPHFLRPEKGFCLFTTPFHRNIKVGQRKSLQ